MAPQHAGHGRAKKSSAEPHDPPPPRKETRPQDAIVDSKGMIWYTDFGKMIVGKLDPKTAKVTEYQAPIVKPGFPVGMLEVEVDKAGDVWLGTMLQGAFARFNQA